MAYPSYNSPTNCWKGCTKCRLHTKRRNVIVSSQLIVHCPSKNYLPVRNNGNHVGVHRILSLPPENIRAAWRWLAQREGKEVLDRNYPHILTIGEAPGESEDLKGVPFYGVSGNILHTIFAYSQSTFLTTVTNTVCCRPVHTEETTTKSNLWGKNREPEEAEQELCLNHTFELLTSYHFDGVLLVGKIAETYNNKFLTHTLPTISIVHPAYIARQDYKLLTIKEQARKLQLWLKTLSRSS